MSADSPFGPVRKWGSNEPRWDPNDMIDLDRETQWQSIREALGDTVCLDTGVPHEASHDERVMALLTYKPMTSPTNTVALETAPVVGRQLGRGGLVAGLLVFSAPFAFLGAWTAGMWLGAL